MPTPEEFRERCRAGTHRLIEAFRDLTGVPMLLNTSFNENEPIVMTPTQALDTFLKTKMDLLVVGNYVLDRAAAA